MNICLFSTTMSCPENIGELSKAIRRKGRRMLGRGLSVVFCLQSFSKTLTRRLKKGPRMVKLVGGGIYSVSSKFGGTVKKSYLLFQKNRRKYSRKKPDKGKKMVESENGEQKDDGVEMVNIVLKVGRDPHCICKGCAKKTERVINTIKSFEGVREAKRDCETNKITVRAGRMVDPLRLTHDVATKTRKRVELLSHLPKKPVEEKIPTEKKQVPQVMSTVTLRVALYRCDKCIKKIGKFIQGYQGVDKDSILFNMDENLVQVKGTMDVKELVASLKRKLKRDVHIVQTNKGDSGEEKDGGGEKRTEGGEASEKNGHPCAVPRQYAYEHGRGYEYENGYNHGLENGYYVYETFSDENPNACAIM